MSRTKPLPCPTTRAKLPNELVGYILGRLSGHNLASASLVSRVWRAIAFPHLYHTVHLSLSSDLQTFSHRLSCERNKQLSVALFTRRLILEFTDSDRIRRAGSRYINQEDLHLLVTVIPALIHLEHFSSRTCLAPRGPQLFQVLKESGVKSVDWVLLYKANTPNFFEDDYWRFFDFQGLTHFSMTFTRESDDPDEEFGEEFAPIISLIQGCPSLESLELIIRAAPWGFFRGTWSLQDFLGGLHPWMSPSLRTFRVLGDVEPTWDYDLRNKDTGVLRSFFMRHPRLETVSLGWAEDGLYCHMVPDVAVLFPSLRHLEAPACLCGPVLSSSLAAQIESVTILDEVYDKFGYNFQILASTVSDLPRLRELVLHGVMDPRFLSIPAELLKALLRAAPVLEKLELCLVLDHPEEILEILKLVPNLRTLATHSSVLESLGHLLSEERPHMEWEVYVPVLARTCPLLKCVQNIRRRDNYAYWIIDRQPDGSIVVSHRAFY